MSNVIREGKRRIDRGVVIYAGTLSIFTEYQNWKLRILNNEIIKCDFEYTDYICLELNYVNGYSQDTLSFSIHIDEFKAYILLG